MFTLWLANIVDSFKQGIHHEGFAATQAAVPPLEPGKNDTSLEGVAKYCVFLTDPDVAPTANGSCITFNHNWPAA